MNATVIQIAIESSYNPADMFKHYVVLKDYNTLVTDLGMLIRKVVSKMIQADVVIF